MADEEIELLEAMFPDELRIIEPNSKLEMTLRPRTDLNSSQGIFVFIVLQFRLPKDYPAVSPVMDVKNARGIDETGTIGLLKQLNKKAEELRGGPALFELIQLARDLLTENNRPHEDCPICLIPFEENEDFVKTPCFHYFHIDCFMSYCRTSVGDLKCPLCRDILSGDFLSAVIGKGESASALAAPVADVPQEPPPPQEIIPDVPPSNYILVTNLGNQSKLDWLGLFDNVFKLYGAQSMTMVSVTTVILEFKDASIAEIALVNTDKTSIGGQKISCRFATPEEFETSKQNVEVHLQLQQLNLQEQEQQKQEQERQKQEQLQQQQPQQQQQTQPINTQNTQDIKHNRENTKFRNPHPRHRPPKSSHSHPTSSPRPPTSTPPPSSATPSSSSSSSKPPSSRPPRKSKPPNSGGNKKDASSDVTVRS